VPKRRREPRERRGGSEGGACEASLEILGNCTDRKSSSVPLRVDACGLLLNLLRRSLSEPEDILPPWGRAVAMLWWTRSTLRWNLSIALYSSPEGLTVAVAGLSSRMDWIISLAMRYLRALSSGGWGGGGSDWQSVCVSIELRPAYGCTKGTLRDTCTRRRQPEGNGIRGKMSQCGGRAQLWAEEDTEHVLAQQRWTGSSP
jgi:hypothetical protein